jgi:signal transduction histidine kinase
MLRDVFESNYTARIVNENEILFNEVEWRIKEDLRYVFMEEHITHEMLWGIFEEEYESQIAGITHNAAYSVERWIDRINHYEGIVYYIEIGEIIHRNTDLNYEQIRQKYSGRVTGETSHDGEEFERYIFALTEEFIAEQNLILAEINNEVRELLTFAVVWLALYLLFGIYLLCSAGRKTTEPGIKTYPVDRIFSEIPLILVFFTIASGIFWTVHLYELSNHTMFKYVYIGVLTLFFVLVYALLSIIIRQVKSRSFIKNFLIFKILKFILERLSKTFKGIGGGINSLFSKQNPMFKATLIVLALGLLTMIPFVGFITVPYMLFVIYKYVNRFKLIKQGVKNVKSGIYNEQIALQGDSEFALLADDINSIAAGLGEEVERRIKSERLKTELIVNVSHDIRTPLTSLITYADLLKNEETDNENISKYAEIISQKSERLKILTDDLFESSKAASGNITVNLENVEINSLLIQALAEFDDRIKKSNLEFKLNMPNEKIKARADGSLLWRVIENLMSNTLKYSLENSRVYIDVSEVDNDVLIEMKNISKSELNIPEDEVAERFKRGDLSRNSEGSGLGLDIASSLMRCQNGELAIKIDGDLFKVCVKIPKILD